MSAHFDEAVALLDVLDDLRKQRLEPLEQGLAAGVADAQPDDNRSLEALAEAVRELLVFGDDDGLMLEGVAPEG